MFRLLLKTGQYGGRRRINTIYNFSLFDERREYFLLGYGPKLRL